MIFFIAALSISALAYCGFVLWILRGLRLISPKPPNANAKHKPLLISVVIAARNEANNIRQCLQSLSEQTYQEFEIILIDDASTDETAIEASSANLNNLVLIRNDVSNGKKPALAKGIDVARGGIIVCTDADCLFEKAWLETVAVAFQEETLGFLSMPVLYHKEKNLFEKCESIDFLALSAIGGALIELGKPAICSGANIAYRRELFYEAGGFGKARFASGDDESVMRNIFRNGNRVRFLNSETAVVKTKPVGEFRAFLNQRIRWASKGTGYGDVSRLFLVALALIYLFNVALFLAPIWMFLGELWNVAAFFFALKFSVDFVATLEMTRIFRRRDLMRIFFYAEFVQIFYVALAPLLAEWLKFGNGYKWKGLNRK